MRFPLAAFAILIAMCLAVPMGAAEAVAVSPTPEQPMWAQIVMLVLTALVVPFLTQYLRKKSQESEAAAAVSNQDYKQRIVERAKAFIFRVAEQFTNKELMDIAQAVVAGKLKTKEEIQERLRGLGVMLKAQAIDYFKSQDIDLVAEFGEAQLDSWIRTAADKLNPFIGQSTSEALLRGGAHFLLSFGVEKAKQAIFTAGVQTQVGPPTGPLAGAGQGIGQALPPAEKAPLPAAETTKAG
jgi:flagellar basal body-associated protein FliL